MIDFLDELGNFKQKIFKLQNVKFYILKCQGRTTQPRLSFETNSVLQCLFSLPFLESRGQNHIAYHHECSDHSKNFFGVKKSSGVFLSQHQSNFLQHLLWLTEPATPLPKQALGSIHWTITTVWRDMGIWGWRFRSKCSMGTAGR